LLLKRGRMQGLVIFDAARFDEPVLPVPHWIRDVRIRYSEDLIASRTRPRHRRYFAARESASG
jgi:hypothetical protein